MKKCSNGWSTVVCWFTASSLFISLSGCQLPEMWKKDPIEDVTPERMQRKENVIMKYEERRDYAQYTAALLRWEEGDQETALESLQKLTARSPYYAPARISLADLYLEMNRPADAEQQLRGLIQYDPGNAQAHHSLGLLLDAQGRKPEAKVHLSRATELEPQNELYQLTRTAPVETYPQHANQPLPGKFR